MKARRHRATRRQPSRPGLQKPPDLRRPSAARCEHDFPVGSGPGPLVGRIEGHHCDVGHKGPRFRAEVTSASIESAGLVDE